MPTMFFFSLLPGWVASGDLGSQIDQFLFRKSLNQTQATSIDSVKKTVDRSKKNSVFFGKICVNQEITCNLYVKTLQHHENAKFKLQFKHPT